MDLLEGYDSSGSSSSKKDAAAVVFDSAKARTQQQQHSRDSMMRARLADRSVLRAAPAVSVAVVSSRSKKVSRSSEGAVAGPWTVPKPGGACKTVEGKAAFDEFTFQQQRKAFQKHGVALGPDVHGSVVTATHKQTKTPADETDGKRKRHEQPEEEGEEDVDGTFGVWAPPSAEERAFASSAQSTMALLSAGVVGALTPEQAAERAHIAERNRRRLNQDDNEHREEQEFDRLVERKMSHLLSPKIQEDPVLPTTKFHFGEEHNYKGQTWIHPPAGTPTAPPFQDAPQCFVPKKCVLRFTGPTKGLHRIRLFPHTGHLILGAGLDGTCKVWSLHTKQLMRTYLGHSAAVRDVQFNNDGTQFLSASFDRYIRLWDTESGQVLGTYTNRRVPYVLQFYPKDNTTFVAGCSDHKIVAYNVRSGEITQEYNHHEAPVNTITFVEDGTKMVSTSDDKVLIWEWDIGVPIKYISDPMMHSLPVITLHPNGMFLCGQSLDNQIVVYQAKDRFACQKKKRFVGHFVAGYACDITISPDGQFIMSGDGEGKIYFWSWKRQKLLQKYRAHDNGPAIGCIWHPTLPSTVLTCGWDGIIKMWQ